MDSSQVILIPELPFSYWSLAAPFAVLLSTTVAILLTRLTINNQRKMNRRKAAFDVMLQVELDLEAQKACHIFANVRDSHGGLQSLAKPPKELTSAQIDEGRQIDKHLNIIEMICVGMMEDTLDELVIYQSMRGSLIHDWHAAQEYASICRDLFKNEKLFQKIQIFAENWEDNTFVTRKDKPDNHDQIKSSSLNKQT